MKLFSYHHCNVPVVDLLKIQVELLPHRNNLRPVETKRGENEHEHGENLDHIGRVVDFLMSILCWIWNQTFTDGELFVLLGLSKFLRRSFSSLYLYFGQIDFSKPQSHVGNQSFSDVGFSRESYFGFRITIVIRVVVSSKTFDVSSSVVCS